MPWDEEFVAFVRESTDDLFRTAFLLCGERERAADLVQETLSRLYPNWDRVHAAEVPIAYVRRCVVNQFLSESRRRSSREAVLGVVPDRGYSSEDADIARLTLAAPLAALPARQRAAVVLHYLYDLSDREAARAMNCTQAAFRGYLRRGVSQLRADLLARAPDTSSEGRA